MIEEQIRGLVADLERSGVPTIELAEVREIAGDSAPRLRRLLERKRFGEPNSYLKGRVTRYGRDFAIDRRTYIPDRGPEKLIDCLVHDLPIASTVLDVGTGCGWIAITLACERPDIIVYAADIDPAALDLAQSNAASHAARVGFFESHFVSDVEGVAPEYVVAVLPYGGDADDYTWRELEERPQMPPISICDPAGPLEPQRRVIRSIIEKGWRCSAYIETGYLSEPRVRLALADLVKDVEYHRTGEYSFIIVSLPNR